MSTSAFATSAARKSRSTGGVRFPVLGAAAGNVRGSDAHADRSVQNAVVLSMMACRMAGKFRTPEKEMGRPMAGQISRPALPSGGWDLLGSTHAMAGRMLISIAMVPQGASLRRRVTAPGRKRRPLVTVNDPLQPLALLESRPSTKEPKRHRAESAPFIRRIERDSLG